MPRTRTGAIIAGGLLIAGIASCSDDTEVTRVEAPQERLEERRESVDRQVRLGPLSRPGKADAARTRHQFAACESSPDKEVVYPQERWETAGPSASGWSEEGLERAWARAREGNYVAGMLVRSGRVVGWFGDVDKPFEAESIRKSLLNPIIGQLVAEGELSLGQSLGELGIEEDPPLNAIERSATLRDLAMSRSGIYRKAAHTTASQDEERPNPGRYRPGEHFFYNNWDFNVLGAVAERAAGQSIFAAFRDRVAAPIGMQDYSLRDTRYVTDEGVAYPAYLFRLSTRDRARFGYLYLRNGCWDGRQVVPAAWVKTSTAPLTDREGELDYGYLWWSQEGIESQGLDQRIFMARGNPLQYIMVFPELDTVLVLTANRNFPGWINWARNRLGLVPDFEDYADVLKLVLEARSAQHGPGASREPEAAALIPDGTVARTRADFVGLRVQPDA